MTAWDAFCSHGLACGSKLYVLHWEQEKGAWGYWADYKGYMLSFNFNKKKQAGISEIAIGDKISIEAVV